MTIGVLHLELAIPGALSLKDKRRAVKSFKDRIAHAHNVSIAEVASLDAHRRAEIAVVMVSNDRRYVEGALQIIANKAAMDREMVLTDWNIEWL
jgi:uncharacterized protein YlxP (DUF503 family)